MTAHRLQVDKPDGTGKRSW